LHLALQGADGRVQRRQLTFQAIPPEAQHPHLAFLVSSQTGGARTVLGAATVQREHVRMGETVDF
jgi:hypothetical protein